MTGSEPQGRDRRRHPRVELIAQVRVYEQPGVTHLLRATNASEGGLFLQGTATNYPTFTHGTGLDIIIFDLASPDEPDDESTTGISARARIVRVEASGFGLVIEHIEEQDRARLSALLEQAG